MNKPFGMRAELQGFPWTDLAEEFEEYGIGIKIAGGIMDVGYDNEGDTEKAKKIAQFYINSKSLSAGQKIKANFNHTWRPNAAGGHDQGISLSDQVNTSDRVKAQTQTHEVSITGRARIISQEMHDSSSFTNDTPMVEKALKDGTLAEALGHFSEETINNDRPLYGVYKALEQITRHLGKGKEGQGRVALAGLLNEKRKYVDDIMETAQAQRHSRAWIAAKKAKVVLSDVDCIQRAKILIEAYANSLS